MNIVFICGSLEPGRDGVGDYTRRLAAELAKTGHKVSVVALRDKFIQAVEEKVEEADGVFFASYRIPVDFTTAERFVLARTFINRVNPQWLSLQFVPFSFHPKGLSTVLASQLETLGRGRSWHIMFHELWVGVNGKESYKHRLLGLAQKFLIKDLIKKLRPASITTSLSVYKQALSRHQVEILPLFGNIPVCPFIEDNAPDNYLRVVHFGTFTSSSSDFLNQLLCIKRLSTSLNKKIKFICFGEGGPYKSRAMVAVEEIFGPEVTTDYGRLSASEVSRQLHLADLGISRADVEMAGKSGTTIAMLEHGLPVLLRGSRPAVTDHQSKAVEENHEFLFADESTHQVLLKRVPESRLPGVSVKFCKQLAMSENVKAVGVVESQTI